MMFVLHCRLMICCDQCGEWYHFKCIGLSEDNTEMIDGNESYICTKCKNDETEPLAPLWFPSGPSFSFFPYPVIDAERPWGKKCQDCGSSCSGHYVTDIDKLLLLHKNRKAIRALPPSLIVEEAFKSKSNQSPSIQSLAKKCCLKEEEVKMWWDHLTTTATNRARGHEKAKATRERKRKAKN